MIVCPVNVVRNWEAEFQKFLPASAGSGPSNSAGPAAVPVHVLDDRRKKTPERCQTLSSWTRGGGVLILGYDMLLALLVPKTPLQKSHAAIVHSALSRPGPDVSRGAARADVTLLTATPRSPANRVRRGACSRQPQVAASGCELGRRRRRQG